ncbi:phage integrase central domain-containing protein [Polynucleobacter sp.]|uniref:phage integrase central domain-containing protein n=1 Tax=Polynucleobacter sp. TaxID=2029855 RepID=UPI0037CA3951
MALRWFEGLTPNKSPDHVKTILKRLEADVFPYIGRMPMGEITAPLLITIVHAEWWSAAAI